MLSFETISWFGWIKRSGWIQFLIQLFAWSPQFKRATYMSFDLSLEWMVCQQKIIEAYKEGNGKIPSYF
jgi:hypothetical protein